MADNYSPEEEAGEQGCRAPDLAQQAEKRANERQYNLHVLATEVAFTRQEIAEVRRLLQKLDADIRGNGRRGLTTRISLVEAFVTSQKRLWWVVIAGIAGTIVTNVL